MAGPKKYGAFAGVFTPSILTILGVIMYLRLPNVVGAAGLWAALGIVFAAHVISITTGLSVSSIATDKRVKAGGSYYIISRSLGLPLGGTLGLALFVGLSFAVSLYLIGFAESFLTFWELGIDPATGRPDIDAIRLTGSIALFVVTVVTFISTSLAIKTQFFIMTAIALSLVSIFIGNPDMPAPETVHLEPLPDGAPLIVLFAIFFPAVTGFEAGVSMSGDLKNPQRDIPNGTLLAIGVGLIVYIIQCVYFAYRIPAEDLAHNPRVLLDYAFFAPAVVAGIWGATISSALGSILGAPRILQAAAMDRVVPRFFAKGSGPDNEPRNAVLLAFLIAQGGILIGSLDAIAAVVTMFFMASYGVLNLSCAVESWASPDFRPEFKIPRVVSLIGAVVCAGLMVMLDMAAMVAATLVMAAVYIYLKRKQLALEGGDTWTGIWSAMTRKALDRLNRQPIHERNWRPHILMFTGRGSAPALRNLGHALIQHNGVITEYELRRPDEREEHEAASTDEPERPEAYFRRVEVTHDPAATMLAAARYAGVAGYEPNTVIVDWDHVGLASTPADALVSELETMGRHTLIALHTGGDRAEPAGAQGGRERFVDVWWRGDGRNAALGLAVVRFLSTSSEWVQATPRFFCIVADPGRKRPVEHRLAAWLSAARVAARVRVLDAPVAPETWADLVSRVSAEASLVVVGLEGPSEAAPVEGCVDALASLRCPILLARAARTFENPFPRIDLGEGGDPSETAASDAPRERPATIELGLEAGLAHRALTYHDRLASIGRAFDDCGANALFTPIRTAQEAISRLKGRALDQLERAAELSQAARRRRAVFRIERALVQGARQALVDLAEALGGDEAETLRIALAVLDDQLRAVEEENPETLIITLSNDGRRRRGRRGDEAAQEDTQARGRHGRDFVRWPLRRHLARVHEREAPALVRRSFTQLAQGRTRLLASLDAFAAWALAEVSVRARRVALDEAALESDGWERARARHRERDAGWRQLVEHIWGSQQQLTATFARDAAQAVATALTDPMRTRRVRRPRRAGPGPLDVDALAEELAALLALQRHHVARSELDVTLRGFHQDLVVAVDQLEVQLRGRLEQRALRAMDELLAELEAVAGRLEEDPRAALSLSVPAHLELDAEVMIQRLSDAVERAVEALPENIDTLSTPSFQALDEGRLDEVQEISVAVRRLVSFVAKTDLVGKAREVLVQTDAVALKASDAIRNVVRVVSFTGAGDLDHDDLVDERREIFTASIDRIGAHRRQLARALNSTLEVLREQLDRVIAHTLSGAIGQSAETLDRFIRTRERAGFRARLRAVGERLRTGFRGAMVDLSYRWSRGVLLARRLETSSDEPASAVERCIALHRVSAPSARVQDALPIFYRQIFLGRAASDPSYWLPASEELEAAARAIASFRSGHRGALWVTGAPRSGVGAVLRRLVETKVAGETFEVRAVPGGSIDPARFDEAVCAAVGLGGDVDAVLANLPEGAVIVVDELELWWERSPGGLAVLEHLEGLIERHGGHTLFILGVGEHLMRLLRRLGVLVSQALATVHCQPLEALRLREAVMLRHEATGLGLRLAGESREPNEWKMARLFAGLFDYSGGHIGAALHGWIAHIEDVTPTHVVVRRFQTPELAPLDALPADWVAMLLELLMHRHITRDRLLRVTGMSPERLDATLAALRRSGLAVEGDDGAFAVDRFMLHHVDRWFRAREVL